MEEQERTEAEVTWDVARAAVRRLQSVLIANASRLDTPFSNAAGSPWSTFVVPALLNLRRAVGLRDGTPETWSLPPEPGPEVTAVRDNEGDLWTRRPNGWHWVKALQSNRVDDWQYVMHFAPLVDASHGSSTKTGEGE